VGALIQVAVLVTTAAGFAVCVVRYLSQPESFHLANERALRPALCAVQPQGPIAPPSDARGSLAEALSAIVAPATPVPATAAIAAVDHNALVA
jgi:hypothetical protein